MKYIRKGELEKKSTNPVYFEMCDAAQYSFKYMRMCMNIILSLLPRTRRNGDSKDLQIKTTHKRLCQTEFCFFECDVTDDRTSELLHGIFKVDLMQTVKPLTDLAISIKSANKCK